MIELMIVVAIIGLLSTIAISSYQTYATRAQVSEGLTMMGTAKDPVVRSIFAAANVRFGSIADIQPGAQGIRLGMSALGRIADIQRMRETGGELLH